MGYIIVVMYVIGLSFLAKWWNKKIGYEYPDWSLATVLAIGTSIYMCRYVGTGLYGFLLSTLVVVLVQIHFIDIKYLEIPDSYNLAVFLLGIANVCILRMPSFLITGILLFVIFYVLSLVSGGAVGGGDIKLSIGIGFFFPVILLGKYLMYTFISGAIMAVVMLLLKKADKKSKMPFGPFMVIGIIGLFELMFG